MEQRTTEGTDQVLHQTTRPADEVAARDTERRAQLLRELLLLFRSSPPTEDQMQHVADVATVAMYQVESAHQTHPPTDTWMLAKDNAECAALYGYVMGYNRALQAQHA